MASIEKRKKTTRVIAYVDGERHTFALGAVSKKVAERFADNIDTLMHERRCNFSVSREVSVWLAGLDDSLYAILAQKGLVEARQKAEKLEAFIEAYIDGRTDVTERRRGKMRVAQKRLVEYFGDVELKAVNAGLAFEYSRHLLKELAPATAQKECQLVSQFFRHAQRRDLIEKNPFEGISVGSATNDERRVFVEREKVEQVIDACPDWQWRTVVALARYGGLRCSSEVALLKWSDIHWDKDRMTVTSPKTERYGKASRIVPIFPELKSYLDEAHEMSGQTETYVVPMLGGVGDKNLGTTFKKIIKRAGVAEWPKPFQNLRASRQTELEQTYPTYVVCDWIGNTPSVAHKHYLTVTDDHFASATSDGVSAGNFRGMKAPDKRCPR